MTKFSLPALKEAISSAGDHLKAMKRSIERFKAEKHELESAPLSRDDLSNVIHAYIDREAEKFEKEVFECLGMFTSHPLDKYRNQIEETPNAVRLKIINALPAGRFDDEHFFLQSALFWVMRDLVKERMGELIKKKWPEKNSKPMKERIARIAELDKEINKLEAEEAEIRNTAAREGVRLPNAPSLIRRVLQGRMFKNVEVE